MKKSLIILIAFITLFLISCDNDDLEVLLEVESKNITLNIDEEYQIKVNIKNNKEDVEFFYFSPSDILDVSNQGLVVAKKEGSAEVYVTVDKYLELEVIINFTIIDDKEDDEPQISIVVPKVIIIGESVQFGALDKLDTGSGIRWVSDTPEIARISTVGVATGIKEGTASFRVISLENGFVLSFEVEISKQLVVKGIKDMEVGQTITLIGLDRLNRGYGIMWVANTPHLATITQEGEVTAIASGIAKFALFSLENGEELVFEIEILEEKSLRYKEKLEELLGGNVMGAQVVAYNDGEIIKYNYGYSSFSKGTLVQDETIFRIASIAKIVIAMAAMKVIEDGKLNLDDDIGDILGYPVRNPYFPDDKITVEMLMVHSATFMDGSSSYGYNSVNGDHKFVALEDLISNKQSTYYTNSTFGNYKPGTRFSYSNFGSGILASVIEKASGEHFTNYVRDNFMKPLGINGGFKADELENQHLISDAYYYNSSSKQYTVSVSGPGFVSSAYQHYPLGNNFRAYAGSLYISMQDLCKIMIVLMNDGKYENKQILRKETVDMMLQTQFVNPDGSDSYKAKGLQLKIVDEINGVVLKGHTGGAYGIVSEMFFSKELNQGVCYIMNGGSSYSYLPGFDNLMAGAIKHFLDIYPKEENNVIKLNLNTLESTFNTRKLVFKDLEVVGEDVFLSLTDLSSILNVPPLYLGGRYFIFNKEITIVNGKINLYEFLDKIEHEYEINNSVLTIYQNKK